MSVVGSVDGTGVLWIGDDEVLRKATRQDDRAIRRCEPTGQAIGKPVAAVSKNPLGGLESSTRCRVNACWIRLQTCGSDAGCAVESAQQRGDYVDVVPIRKSGLAGNTKRSRGGIG